MKPSQAMLAFALFFSAACFAQDIPESPQPPRLVNDFAGILSAEEEEALEQKLLSWEDSTSNQLAVVTIQSLNGMDVSDFSVRLAEKWKIGSAKNNGLLLLVAMAERKSRIEVGYGLEGRITDAVSRRILAEDLKPAFKQARYAEGLNQAADHLISAAAGEYKAEAKKASGRKKGKGLGLTGLIIILVVLYLISKGRRGGGGGGFLTGMLLGNMLGGHRHSSWGDFSSGSGSFGGFGGGSFGGGGASGDW